MSLAEKGEKKVLLCFADVCFMINDIHMIYIYL